MGRPGEDAHRNRAHHSFGTAPRAAARANYDGRHAHRRDGPRARGRAAAFDYSRFAERFRGSEEYVTAGQQFYLPYFQNCKNVLDIGCGRGEFLKMMRDAGVPARGIELCAESVAVCRAQGLEAEIADAY